MIDLASADVQVDAFICGSVRDHYIVVRWYCFLLQCAICRNDRRNAIKPLCDLQTAGGVLGLIRIDDCNSLGVETGFG